ncbi:olfactory receptor 5AR1-like [Pelodytes ibericus]
MKSENQDNISGFIIETFTDIPELQFPVFLIFLFIYIIIICGNVAIFVFILSDSTLHTPMYIFLVVLSFIDISSASNIIPLLLHMLLTQHKKISFHGCMLQMYVFLSLTCVEVYLLGAMAYDRYVAICHPLHYFILMSVRHCALMITTAWSVGFLSTIGHATMISKLSYCASHLIDHFFCDVTPLLKLSCSNTSDVEMLNYVEGTLVIVPDFLLTCISYMLIISSILKIQSAEGRYKAFSTCTSHLTCVIMFYGTLMSLYMRPASSYSLKQNKLYSLLNIVLVPMLNPLIYSLKNQDVKHSMRKLMNRIVMKISCFRVH